MPRGSGKARRGRPRKCKEEQTEEATADEVINEIKESVDDSITTIKITQDEFPVESTALEDSKSDSSSSRIPTDNKDIDDDYEPMESEDESEFPTELQVPVDKEEVTDMSYTSERKSPSQEHENESTEDSILESGGTKQDVESGLTSEFQPRDDEGTASQVELSSLSGEMIVDSEVHQDVKEVDQEEAIVDAEVKPVNDADQMAECDSQRSDGEVVSDEEATMESMDQMMAGESEDEVIETNKKKQQKNGDDLMSSKASLKRPPSTISEGGDNGGVPAKKQAMEKSPSVPKPLPELEKYWKAVKEDPADFTGWTYLLQYVDQENDVEAAREAYDTFLSHYPYCYGYWRKYADYEKRKGDKSRSQDVFEKGLYAIPLSVDLWLHYLNHIKLAFKDDEEYIRSQYKRAIDICGIEFRADRLWDSFIKWETEGKNYSNVCAIYDRVFTIPTLGYKTHFENFEDFVMSNQPNKMLGVDEFLTLRAEVLQKLRQKPPSESAPAANAPPGDESDEEVDKGLTYADEETKLMREKIISSRKKIFKATSIAVLDRWNFEEGIKRPYFHVKPLERCQLNNWKDYLDFEIRDGGQERAIVLFERCLIACALYDEFWVKYIKYLESLGKKENLDKIRSVYERACTIHHPKKPMLALNWAYFEEDNGNVEASRKILCRIEKEIPNSLQIEICRINLERRAANHDEVCKLYDSYISTCKSKYASNALSIKYARFCQRVISNVEKGCEVLRKAIEKDRDNPRLYHQLFDLVFSKCPRTAETEKECTDVIDDFLKRDSADIEHKVLLAQHKVEFLEDFGSSWECVQKAYSDYELYLKLMKDKRHKQFEEKVSKEVDAIDKKIIKAESNSNLGVNGSPNNVPSTQYTSQQSYSQQQQQQQQQTGNYQNSNQYGSSSTYGQPYNQYNNQSDPNYNNYQNWNYSQTGYNNYNQGWGSYNYY